MKSRAEGMGIYKHLERDGLPSPEVELSGIAEHRDSIPSVLVGKTSPPRFLEESQGAFLQAQEGANLLWG